MKNMNNTNTSDNSISNFSANLSKRLRMYRENYGYTQSEVAKKLSVTSQAYSHYENDERDISISAIVKLSRLYRISIDELLGLNDYSNFTNDEQSILLNFRKLDDRGKQSVLRTIEIEREHCKNEEK